MLKKETFLASSLVVETKGKIEGSFRIFTDSRVAQGGNCFLALDGPKFRGVHFLPNCPLVIVNNDRESREIVEKTAPQGAIFVKDTLLYLQEMAQAHLVNWPGTVIGITGSNGKTTVKEMLYHILQKLEGEKVWASEKNFNNHIGVPLTILALTRKHRFLVLEMGTNHPGELERLCQIASPHMGLITNIGDSHLAFFGDRAGVFKEKKALYQRVKENNGPFLINTSDPYLKKLGHYEKSFTIDKGKKGLLFTNNHIVGDFNFFNMAMSATMALILFPHREREIVKAIESYRTPSNNRSCQISRGGKEIFLDAYNANPSSMRASLEFFISQLSPDEPPLFILGDMNELGDRAEEFHREIGAILAKAKGEGVFIGHYANAYQKGFGREAHCYPNRHSFLPHWPKLYKKHKKIFIKGSRTLQLEVLLDIN